MSLPPISFATDIELRDQRFAEKLQRRRKLLLRWSLPVVLLAALVSLKFLTATGLNLIGTSAYDRANYATAADRYVNTQAANVVEPWKAFYNEGTAHYSAGKFFTASERFAEALDRVPKAEEGAPREPEECLVRVNYSLSLEGMAAESLTVGDIDASQGLYEEALEMLADCASSGNGGDTAEDAQERQEQGQDDAEQQAEERDSENDPDGDPEDGDPEKGDPETGEDPEDEVDPQQEELEERNQRANEGEFDEDSPNEGTGDGSGQNW